MAAAVFRAIRIRGPADDVPMRSVLRKGGAMRQLLLRGRSRGGLADPVFGLEGGGRRSHRPPQRIVLVLAGPGRVAETLPLATRLPLRVPNAVLAPGLRLDRVYLHAGFWGGGFTDHLEGGEPGDRQEQERGRQAHEQSIGWRGCSEGGWSGKDRRRKNLTMGNEKGNARISWIQHDSGLGQNTKTEPRGDDSPRGSAPLRDAETPQSAAADSGSWWTTGIACGPGLRRIQRTKSSNSV